MIASLDGVRTAISNRFQNAGRVVTILVLATGCLATAGFLVWVFNKLFYYYLARSYVAELAKAFDLNPHLADAIVWFSFATIVYLAANTFSFSKTRRTLGLLGLLGLAGVHSLFVWYAVRDHNFERSGTAAKCYVVTRTGIKKLNHVGIDPDTGRECRPITPEIVEKIDAYASGRRPAQITDSDPLVYDALTGEPVVWFARGAGGDIELYDLMGFHPKTGEELKPVDNQIVDEWKRQNSVRCYVLTRNGIRTLNHLGVDPETRECIPVFPSTLARIKTYLNGKRPTRVAVDEPTFFDPQDGGPTIWYAKNAQGDIELFDLMGFHPQTGQELVPTDEATAQQWKEQRRKLAKAPARIDPNNYDFFDLRTGVPRAWYWRSSDGEWEFYDNSGFQPKTGEPLQIITRDAIDRWKAETEKKKSDQEKAEREKRDRAEQEERDTQARAEAERQSKLDDMKKRQEQAFDDLRKRQEEAAKQQQASADCDRLAGNPTDPRRASDGIPFDQLKLQIDQATDACERAVKQYPAEPRYRYQLGRALQIKDRVRAFEIHSSLVRAKYPAAFDNLGWIYLYDRKDQAAAVQLFRAGSELGDPDAMVSLAEVIERGYFTPPDPLAWRLALLKRAAELGHPGAQRAMQAELLKIQQSQIDAQRQMQTQQQMMQVFQMLIQHVH